MQDEPTPTELTKAVADFLRNDIAPLISGHQAFKLRDVVPQEVRDGFRQHGRRRLVLHLSLSFEA